MKPTLTPNYQPELFEPEHVSLQEHRLDRMPEFVYAKRWKKLNERSPGVNHGYTALEWILAREPKTDGERAMCRFHGLSGIPGVVSQRDAAVAASVIQWLGTNCGHGFLLEAEREIAKIEECRRTIEAERRKVHRVNFYRVRPRPFVPRRALTGGRSLAGFADGELV